MFASINLATLQLIIHNIAQTQQFCILLFALNSINLKTMSSNRLCCGVSGDLQFIFQYSLWIFISWNGIHPVRIEIENKFREYAERGAGIDFPVRKLYIVQLSLENKAFINDVTCTKEPPYFSLIMSYKRKPAKLQIDANIACSKAL